MESFGIDIHLGEHEYRVQPQRTAYLRHKLGALISEMQETGDLNIDSADSFLDLFNDRLHELLSVFIPDLMPKWEWEGYGSESAYEAREYDETGDRSPTVPEITFAIKTAIKVNDFDWVKSLTDFVGMDFLRAQARASLAQWASESAAKRRMPSSTSPSPSADSPPTTSSPSSPTTPPHLTSV